MTPDELMAGLPGEELIREGLADLRSGRHTVAACLTAMSLPRLRRAGMTEDFPAAQSEDAEMELYRLLRETGGDAYSRYNSLVRRLVSFEQALDWRMR